MIIVLQVNAPPHMAQAVKESIAMDLEKYGDVKVLEVRDEKERESEQIRLYGGRRWS